MDLTFQPESRLTEAEYDLLKKDHSKKVYPFFVCLYRQAPQAKLGIISAKKSVRLAVDRNRCRRIIRESFRLNKHLFLSHVIIIVRYKAVDVDNATLFKCLDRFWHSVAKSSAGC